MERTARRVLTAIAMLGLLLLAVGCGTVDANFHLKYTRAGDLEGRITLRCTGALGSYLLTPELKDFLVEEGWKVTTDVDGDVTTLSASHVAKRGEWTPGLEPLEGAPGAISGFDVQERGGLFTRNYEARLMIPEGLWQQGLPDEVDDESLGLLSQEDLNRMLDGMLKVSFSVTLPGRVVESNADKVEGNTATWYYTYSGLQVEREMYVQSQDVLWGRVAAVTVAAMLLFLAVVVSLVVLLLVRRRKPATAQGPFAG